MSETYSSLHKVPPYQIREMTNADPDFYATVGPWLARRDIVKELGGPVWDEDDKAWHVAVTGSGEILGMIGLRWRSREICSFYVSPGSRGLSVGYALLRSVLEAYAGTLDAVANENSRPLFLAAGFVDRGARGRFHLMRLEDTGV